MSPRSLLVISAAPDDRPSTATLLALVAELRRRPGLRTRLWFLRRGEGDVTVADRVVDDLRSASAASLADGVGLGRVAGVVQGRVLRRWWKEAAPDAVILDDGLGARVVSDHHVATVVRTNDVLPADAELEEPPAARADLWIVAGTEIRPDGPVITAPTRLRDLHRVLEYRDPSVRDRVRRRLGVPEHVPLVVAWGSDAWLDGADVFIRCLWSLEHSHGVRAWGLWIGLDPSDEDVERLESEARRCGVEGRIVHVHRGEADDARFCGDVVLLPHRAQGPTMGPLDELLVTGAQVVASDVTGLAGPGITSIAALDADAAGAALARCLHADRDAVGGELARAYHVGPLADDLLASLDGILGRV